MVRPYAQHMVRWVGGQRASEHPRDRRGNGQRGVSHPAGVLGRQP